MAGAGRPDSSMASDRTDESRSQSLGRPRGRPLKSGHDVGRRWLIRFSAKYLMPKGISNPTEDDLLHQVKIFRRQCLETVMGVPPEAIQDCSYNERGPVCGRDDCVLCHIRRTIAMYRAIVNISKLFSWLTVRETYTSISQKRFKTPMIGWQLIGSKGRSISRYAILQTRLSTRFRGTYFPISQNPACSLSPSSQSGVRIISSLIMTPWLHDLRWVLSGYRQGRPRVFRIYRNFGPVGEE
jgi:hypothetical protein